MKIGAFRVQYLAHVCFLFTSPSGARVITDPFFSKRFIWQGKTERYLTPPAMPASAIRRCDAVFVSHEHGDHFDPDAVTTIVRNTGAKVWAAEEILDVLRARGVPERHLVGLKEGMTKRLPGMTARMYAGYDGSLDARGRPNKFALLLQSGPTRIFYSGDCHEAPPAVVGKAVDAVFSWPHPDDAKLAKFARAFRTKKFVLMHGDRFQPGNFWCNFSYEDHKPRVERAAPGVEVVIPKRVKRISC